MVDYTSHGITTQKKTKMNTRAPCRLSMETINGYVLSLERLYVNETRYRVEKPVAILD